MPLSEDHLLITLRSSCQQLGATHVAHAVPVTTSRMWNSLPVYHDCVIIYHFPSRTEDILDILVQIELWWHLV